MREVGQRPHEYDCASCPWTTRLVRRCAKAGDGQGGWEREQQAALQQLPPDPSAEEACAVLRIEQTPRVARWVGQWGHWSKHGWGPHGPHRETQAPSFLAAMSIIEGELGQLERERDKARDADSRAREAGVW